MIRKRSAAGQAALLLLLAFGPGPAGAQPARPAARPPATFPATPPAPASTSPASNSPASSSPAPAVPSVPQQTTASFADWTLRCSRTTTGAQLCEVGQGVQRDDRPVAQVALGRPGKGQPLQLTVLVPPSVSLGTRPSLLGGPDGQGTPVAELTWRRCLPGACLADAPLTDELVDRLRGWTQPGRIVFVDAANHPAVLPFSPRGLAQALDALAKEDGG